MRASETTAAPMIAAPGVSLHRQLFLVLRDQIARGIYPSGALLPGVDSLCADFGVSGITIRRALTDLARAGYVQRLRGLGTFVREDLPRSRPTVNAHLIANLSSFAESTQVDVINLSVSVPPTDVGALLAIAPGEPAMNAIRRRKMGKLPLMLTDAWIPKDLGRKVNKAALKAKPLFEILREQGEVYGKVVQEYSAVSADPSTAKLLECEISSPLILMTRLYYDVDGRPIQYLTAHVVPDRSRILMEVPSESINALSGGQIVHDNFRSSVERRGSGGAGLTKPARAKKA